MCQPSRPGTWPGLPRGVPLLPVTRPSIPVTRPRPAHLTLPWHSRGLPERPNHGIGQNERAMTATILDGKASAASIREDLTRRVARLAEAGITPGLGTVLVGDDPGSHSYVAGKHRDCAQVGILSIRRDLPADASQQQVEDVIGELNADPACTGYIVQLPLPGGLNAQRVLELMDPAKDADGLHPMNLGRLVLGEPAPLPCTPRGIVELLRRFGVPIDGAEVTVIGRGITVGRSLGLLLTRRSENATVTLCHTGTRDLAAHTTAADIVV